MDGFAHVPGYFSPKGQAELMDAVDAVIEAAPLFVPRTPRLGRPFSVRMTNCGALGWVSDKERGYRYESVHPQTGLAWPPMPQRLVDLWAEFSACPAAPEACLINYYSPKAKLGMHQDKDEEDFSAPLISVSLGATAIFRLGGLKRRDPSRTFELRSGDVLILGGRARLAYHGVDRILAAEPASPLIAEGGRINLTLRRVTRPA
jgi:alkylated DNA repair protein (DNA oxidative demethylase)